MGCRVVSLGDVIQLEDSKRQPLSSRERDSRKGSYPYYGAQGIVDYLDDYTYEGDYLLVAEDGENLRSRKQPIANAAQGRFRVNNHAHVIAATKRCNLTYLRHLLNSMDITAYVTGSTQPKLSQTSLLNMKIELPEIDKQDAIAAFLHCFDAKSSTNAKLNGYLEELVVAAFSRRFDAIKSTTELGEVLSISTKSLKPQDCCGEIWEHYSIPAYDTNRRPVFELADNIKSSKYAIDANCILISKLNPNIKRIWMPACSSKQAVCSTEFIVYRPKNPAHKSFYYAAINAPAFTDFLLAHVTGSTGSRQRAQPKATLTYPMPAPGEEAIENFCIFADPIYEQIKANDRNSKQLEELRDALLPKLMSGEIDVSKVDLTPLNSHLAE